MRFCPTSSNCPYGSIYEENTCAYYDDNRDFDCPLLWMNSENIIDEINKNNN